MTKVTGPPCGQACWLSCPLPNSQSADISGPGLGEERLGGDPLPHPFPPSQVGTAHCTPSAPPQAPGLSGWSGLPCPHHRDPPPRRG